MPAIKTNGPTAEKLPPHELVQRGLEEYHQTFDDNGRLQQQLDRLNVDVKMAMQENDQLRHLVSKAESEADHYKFLYAECVTQLNTLGALITDALRAVKNAPYARSNSAAAALKQQQLNDIDEATKELAKRLAPPEQQEK